MKRSIRFVLNGDPVSLDTDDNCTLLWVFVPILNLQARIRMR